MAATTTSHPVSSGVQELIERLRREGVEAGEQEAEATLKAARRQADEILGKAHHEAEALRVQTRKELVAERDAAHEALRLAARDLQLDLKERLTARFQATVKQLVNAEMRQSETLRGLILAVAGKTGGELGEQPLQIELGAADEPAALDALTQELARGLLRDGVELVAPGESAGPTSGLKIRLDGRDAEVDLSADAIANLLLRRLTPRFRELFAALGT